MAKHADAAHRRLRRASGAKSTAHQHDSSTIDDQDQAGETDNDALAEDDPKRFGLKRFWRIQPAVAVVVAVVVALAGLCGWLGYRTYDGRQAQAQRNQWIAAARQGALNLTTVDYAHVDADVHRILDSSTRPFRDDFQRRSQAFIDVVKKAQSKSQGTITAAALESQDGDRAQVLVAVSVKTSNADAREQDLRRWRMRIGVQQVSDGVKVSAVKFVP